MTRYEISFKTRTTIHAKNDFRPFISEVMKKLEFFFRVHLRGDIHSQKIPNQHSTVFEALQLTDKND